MLSTFEELEELEELEAIKDAYPGFGCLAHLGMFVALVLFLPLWPPIGIFIVAIWVFAARRKRARYRDGVDKAYAKFTADRAAEFARAEARYAARLAREERERLKRLSQAYDAPTVNRIVARRIEKGDTRDILVEMFGHPSSEREHVLKTKSKVVMKWSAHDVEVTLEKGEAVAWKRSAKR